MAIIRDRGNGSYLLKCSITSNERSKTYMTQYRHPSGISSAESRAEALKIANNWEASIKSKSTFEKGENNNG